MITKFHNLIGSGQPLKPAGYDVTSCFRSTDIEVRKTAENAISDGFWVEFEWWASCCTLLFSFASVTVLLLCLAEEFNRIYAGADSAIECHWWCVCRRQH